MRKRTLFSVLATLVVGVLIILPGNLGAAETQVAEATFYVSWYGVGKTALVGLPGVETVTSGWKGSREINTVIYDPSEISIEAMVAALKEAHTYLGTATE